MTSQHTDQAEKKSLGAIPVGSVSLKLVVIGILLFILMIPSFMIQALIDERAGRQEQTIQEVGSTWGDAQSVVGPVLVIPYQKFSSSQVSSIEYVYILPDTLRVDTTIDTQIRTRGMYDVPVYDTDVVAAGSFAPLNVAQLGLTKEQLLWDQATVVVGIPDMRGVKEQIILNWRQNTYAFSPGGHGTVLATGINTRVFVSPDDHDGYTFSFNLKLRGSDNLSFVPLGKTTTVHVGADWPYPSFGGSFLPSTHAVTFEGFTADWQVLDLNRNLPQQWTSVEPLPYPLMEGVPYFAGKESSAMLDSTSLTWNGTFGVQMFLPVDMYQQTTRSAKYAMAVILLVFATVFFMEVTSRRRVHAVQYLLIGLALVVYYTLLLSLSEYIAFGLAYLIASGMTIAMITLFAKSVMGSVRRALMTGGILAALYAFVFVLLQLQQYTLLIGSIALFGILGLLMYVSRLVQWYADRP